MRIFILHHFCSHSSPINQSRIELSTVRAVSIMTSTSTPRLQTKLYIHETAALISKGLCYHIQLQAKQSIATCGHFTLALSGGSVATQLSTHSFKLAAETLEYVPQYDKWHVFLADERVLKTTDDDSNLKLLRDKSFLTDAETLGCNVYGK